MMARAMRPMMKPMIMDQMMWSIGVYRLRFRQLSDRSAAKARQIEQSSAGNMESLLGSGENVIWEGTGMMKMNKILLVALFLALTINGHAAALPAGPELKKLTDQSLLSFNSAVQKADFTDFYKSTA